MDREWEAVGDGVRGARLRECKRADRRRMASGGANEWLGAGWNKYL